MKTVEFLQAFPFFKKAPEEIARTLADAAQLKSIPATTQIYREGDACGGIAFLIAGDIRVYKIGETGREITLYEIGPGETCILNASCILSGRTYPAHAVALSDITALLVPASVFQKLVKEQEAVREFVFTLLSERLTGVMELVQEIAFSRVDERLKDYLIERSADGRLETTHQKIANDLGTSREVVSRLLKDLERHGQVSLSRSTITLRAL